MNRSWYNLIWINNKARLGIIIVSSFIIIAAVGPIFFEDPNAYIDTPLLEPSFEHLFGTTGQGQDVFAQTISGARSTLFIGLSTGFLIVLLGLIVGSLSGYFGRRMDNVLSLIINIFLLMPGLPLMVIIAAWLPPGTFTIMLVLVITGWAWQARVLRSQVLSLRESDYVNAAIISGESNTKVIIYEIWPQMLSLIMASFIGATVYAIGAQVGLEFLGLGDVDKVTWGNNLYWAMNDLALLTGSWWTFVPTGLCIALVSFGLTLINFGIDEVTNPRLISERNWRKYLPKSRLNNGITPVVRNNG